MKNLLSTAAVCGFTWLALALPAPSAWAHGPDAGHDHAAPAVPTALTSPASPATSSGASAPGAPAITEARSQAFELVASLGGGELSVLIDRFDTNEPVLGATVRVSSGGIQAAGTFHADHGDYAFTDERLLARLSQPGRHELVFTVTQGEVSEAVSAAVEAAAAEPGAHADHGDHGGHAHPPARPAGAMWVNAAWALLLAAVATALVAWLWRRGRHKRQLARLGPHAWVIACVGLLAAAVGDTHAGPGAHGPNGEHLDAPAASGGASGPGALMRLPDGGVQVPKRAQRSMGIRTVRAAAGQHATTLTLNARVVPDPRSAGRVQAPVAGRIEAPPSGLPVAGQAVRRGQVLALVYPVLGAAERTAQQASLAELRANRQVAQRRVERLAQLDGVVPAKDIEAARVELQSLVERERLLARSLDGALPLVAPVGGVLASARALAGQVVEPQAVLFEVVDPQRLRVEAHVSDPAQAAQVTGGAIPGRPDVTLQVVGAARVFQDGGVPLTFQARSEAAVLAIGQPLTVVATLSGPGAPLRAGVAVPAEAVVRNPANQAIAWVKASAERFQPVVVQTVPLDAQRVLVTQGLSADQRVVVQGASLINQVR